MKKSILLLITVLFVSSTAFSQILTEWEFGPTMFSPSITTNGAPDDFEIVSHIKVTNTSPSDMTIKVAVQIMYQVPLTEETFCWAGLCYAIGTDTSGNSMTLAPGEFTEEFSGHLKPLDTEGVSIIKYTFFDVNNHDNKSEVIVHYNSLFSLSSEAGIAVSEHIRFLSGSVDDPINGIIKVHNNSSMSQNFIVLKGAQIVPENTENWFHFGGTQYPASIDTSGLVTIEAATIDESFDGYYNALGVEGSATIVYAFMDPMNPASYAVFMFNFDAALGINEEVLANTTFSSAYPNPADNYVSFDYDIPNEVDDAQILITNLLGAVVYEATIDGRLGTTKIDISNLTEGIYFATLKLDNYIATTQKVLVR